jgi:hypothetical protein
MQLQLNRASRKLPYSDLGGHREAALGLQDLGMTAVLGMYGAGDPSRMGGLGAWARGWESARVGGGGGEGVERGVMG